MLTSIFLSDFFGDLPWALIPLMALAIPIIAILINHQQKMAQIIHGSMGGQNSQQLEAQRQEIERLRNDVQELKQLMHQQAIQLDNIANASNSLPPRLQASETVGGR